MFYDVNDITKNWLIIFQPKTNIKTIKKLKICKLQQEVTFMDLEDVKKNDNIKFIDFDYKIKPTNYSDYFSITYYVWSLLTNNISISDEKLLETLEYTLPTSITIPENKSVSNYHQLCRQTGIYFLGTNSSQITVDNLSNRLFGQNIECAETTNNTLFIFIYDSFQNELLLTKDETTDFTNLIIPQFTTNIINKCRIDFQETLKKCTKTYTNIVIYSFGCYLPSLLDCISNISNLKDINKDIYCEGFVSVTKNYTFPTKEIINLLQDPIVNKKVYFNNEIDKIDDVLVYNPDKLKDVFKNNPNLLHSLYAYDILINNN